MDKNEMLCTVIATMAIRIHIHHSHPLSPSIAKCEGLTNLIKSTVGLY